MGESRAALLAAAGVAGVALGLALPNALVFLPLPNDVMGYVGAARSWLEGQGLVNPVLYSYYLGDATPPVPAPVIQPPLISLLFAVPLALGAGLVGLAVVHTAWASLIGGGVVLVARRLMSLPAAAAAALLVAGSQAWGLASIRLLPDATAVGALLLLVALARSALGSAPRALMLAALTLLAWLARPNLGVFLPVFLAAAVLELGPRAALRSRPLWVYTGALVLGQRALAAALERATGHAPYAHYGVMFETLSMEGVASFAKPFRGALAFASDHLGEILAFTAGNAVATLRLAFDPLYLYVGVVAIPGVVHGLLRRGPEAFEHRLVALAALGFTAVAVATTWGFDDRYLLPGFTAGWLAGMASLDRAAVALVERLPELRPAARRALRASPLALALLVLGVVVGPDAGRRLAFVATRPFETRLTLQRGAVWDRPNRAFCRRIDADALVASPDPWGLYYWCGNAGYLIPSDLADPATLDRYLDERTPGYLIADDPETLALLRASSRLEAAGRHGTVVLFRVVEPAPESRPWRSPGPLADLAPGGARRRAP